MEIPMEIPIYCLFYIYRLVLFKMVKTHHQPEYIYIYNTLWLFNIAMENGPFIDGLPGFTY